MYTPCTSSYRRTPCHNAHHNHMATSLLCTRFSTQHSTLSCAHQPRSYHPMGGTFLRCQASITRSPCSYKVEIAWVSRDSTATNAHSVIATRLSPTTWAPHGHRAIFYLIRPLNRGTLMGTSHGIFLYGSCAFARRRATLLLFKGLSIYNICIYKQNPFSFVLDLLV